jgi:hypothetical protein
LKFKIVRECDYPECHADRTVEYGEERNPWFKSSRVTRMRRACSRHHKRVFATADKKKEEQEKKREERRQEKRDGLMSRAFEKLFGLFDRGGKK